MATNILNHLKSKVPLVTSRGIVYEHKGFTRESVPAGVKFNPNRTEYGVALMSTRSQKQRISAVAGFNLTGGVVDCQLIQGMLQNYLELTNFPRPGWDKFLFWTLVEAGREAGAEEARLIPATLAADIDPLNVDRLTRRYDETAKFFGLRYSDAESRYIGKIAELTRTQRALPWQA